MPIPRSESRPAVVFLDVGDTLVRAHPSWADIYNAVLREFGMSVEPAAFRRAWTDLFVWQPDGPFEATEEASFARIKELDGRILAHLGYPDLPDEFFHALDRAFSARSAWFVFDDVVPALDALRAAGIRLGVISNWTWAAPELLHDLELASHFETLVISARVGFNKPNPGIFRHALELMDVEPAAALHVGDSYQADIVGASAVGMAAVLIARDEDAAVPSAEAADVPVIRDLYGLLDLLGIARPASEVAARGA
ncbi:MAG TPA: HAD-IA family hydrolase [Candidatus Limnocylindria bacterium]|nr:HAD-IA family hydrolase [Candidatus Limnocylindria bacterium]